MSKPLAEIISILNCILISRNKKEETDRNLSVSLFMALCENNIKKKAYLNFLPLSSHSLIAAMNFSLVTS